MEGEEGEEEEEDRFSLFASRGWSRESVVVLSSLSLSYVSDHPPLSPLHKPACHSWPCRRTIPATFPIGGSCGQTARSTKLDSEAALEWPMMVLVTMMMG